MSTATHVSLEEGIKQLHLWYEVHRNQASNLKAFIADAEAACGGLKAKNVMAMRQLSWGSEINVLFLLGCASGAFPVLQLDESGKPAEPAAWRGNEMLDYIVRKGLDALFTPAFEIRIKDPTDSTAEAQNGEQVSSDETLEDDDEHKIAQEDPFDPLSLAQLRTEFCKTDEERRWFDNAVNRGEPWAKDARRGRNKYDSQIIADGFVSYGKLSRERANRILKQLLPKRSKHLEDLFG